MILIKDFVSRQAVAASAPCRIDAGGTWDIKALALPFESIQPTTVNVALTLRTFASLHPYEPGQIKISSSGFVEPEVFPAGRLPFDTRFGLFFAAVSYFGFHGLEVRIDSQSPVRSALGGSSTALVALIRALSTAASEFGGKGLSKKEILHLGYHLEDGVSGGNCGIQDQAAAVYGGVQQWEWQYGNRTAAFRRRALLDREGQNALSQRLLVAYSGKRHTALRTNRQWIRDFLSGRTRAGWLKVNETVRRFGGAIEARDWNQAAALIREEMAVRREITPEALTPTTGELIETAEDAGCGARFTGAGAGGCLWAIGDMEQIDTLRGLWETRLAQIKGAMLLDCGIDPSGVTDTGVR
jgi:D-glycero-alpha-D-manno-heptose-7-phosphate kinase